MTTVVTCITMTLYVTCIHYLKIIARISPQLFFFNHTVLRYRFLTDNNVSYSITRRKRSLRGPGNCKIVKFLLLNISG